MIDSHCHLADAAYQDDLAEVVARCQSAGMPHVLCILAAGDAAEAAQADRLTSLWPGVRYGIGVHPHQARDFANRTDAAVRLVRSELAARDGARALGEVGLDYHYDFSPREVQRDIFAAQVGLARELHLPIVIHTREADQDTVDVLHIEGGGDVTGVFHCFTGTEALARQALDLGFHVSFAGIITFPKAGALRDVASHVPPDRLLVETDSPFLAPVPHRGRRNEPPWVGRTLEALAALHNTTPERLALLTAENFTGLFRP